MTIDMLDLERAWKGLDARLERQELALGELRRRDAMSGLRTRLRLVSAGQIVQLVLALMIVLWSGGYWFDHLGTPHLAVYGVAIHLWALGMLANTAVQLTRLGQLDYGAPVLDAQRRIVALKRARVTGQRVLLVAGFVLWTPITFIALNAATGLDVWATSPATVLWNLLVSIGLAALTAWATYRFRDRFEHDVLGRDLRAAEAEIADWEHGA